MVTALSNTVFRPTDLDLALQADPLAEASSRAIAAAAKKNAASANPEPIASATDETAPPEGAQATREGQRETAAASLAGGMIAAEGRPVTAAEAVQKVRDVLDELDRS